ncbi:hypothetical protein ACFL6R_04120 [Gemmatimonadota bacterium]
MATTRELQEKLVSSMTRWQDIEDAAIATTEDIIGKTSHPLIRTVMEIIQTDSKRHHQVQQMIIDTLEKESVSISPEDLIEVWDLIENHIEIERKTVEFATDALESVKGTKMVVIQYLIEYLLTDENKHNELLDNLEGIKKAMYPYG